MTTEPAAGGLALTRACVESVPEPTAVNGTVGVEQAFERVASHYSRFFVGPRGGIRVHAGPQKLATRPRRTGRSGGGLIWVY